VFPLLLLLGLSGCQSAQTPSQVLQAKGGLSSGIQSYWSGPQLNRRFNKAKYPNTPEGATALYQAVWDLVNQENVDPSLNHQTGLPSSGLLPNWSDWRTHYQGKLKTLDDAYVAIETMLASLNDDYTRFLPPKQMADQVMSIDANVSGVGIQLGMKHNRLWVVAPIDDSPADRAGLLPNDLIIGINGKPSAGLSVEAAADQIRGKAGTPVRITLLRNDKKTITVTLIRQKIHVRSVFGRLLPINGPLPPGPLSFSSKQLAELPASTQPSIGYIRLSSFISETTVPELKAVLARLLDPPKQYPKGLIIDLRSNYGGLLTNAVDIADMFLQHGRIVSIVHRNQSQETYQAQPDPGDITLPLVVLIDGGSASASEIFAGAMQDNNRAVLVGTTSFGKGLVQKINPMPDGSGVNLTISQYRTPKGTDIHKKGITPNVKVDWTEADLKAHKDVQLLKALALLSH
jgi:carboxyl-terminal processing protease